MRLIHVYHTAPDPDPETKRRNEIAAISRNALERKSEGSFQTDGIPVSLLPRVFMDGDRKMAYVKDIIDIGITGCSFNGGSSADLFMLTNEDTGLYPSLCDTIFPMFVNDPNLLGLSGPRRDFACIDHALLGTEEGGVEYIGTDIFVFTPEWWRNNRNTLPDMILGGEAWDLILRGIMRTQNMPSVSDLVYHEYHDARWTRADVRESAPFQQHNRRLAQEWLGRLNSRERDLVFYADPAVENAHRKFTTELAARRGK